MRNQLQGQAYVMKKLFTLSMLCFSLANTAYGSGQNGTIAPIPPERPAKLHASKAYIKSLSEQLKQRDNETAIAPQQIIVDNSVIENNNQPDQPVALQSIPLSQAEQMTLPFDSQDMQLLLVDPSPEEIVKALESFEENAQEAEKSRLTTLISFSMPKSELTLDDNLKSFLKDHALRMLKNDDHLLLEIQSHATAPVGKDEDKSRIALARALETRQFLMDNKINPKRVKIRPLPQSSKEDPDDRIDLIFSKLHL